MSDDAIARVNLSSQADRPSEDDDALYYDLLELVDASEDTADEMAWVKGAAIAKIEAKYGESRRQLFATAARIARSTAYEYAQMFRFWLPVLKVSAERTFFLADSSSDVREVAIDFHRITKLLYPSLRRTDFRRGMRIGNKLGVEAALAYVNDCQGRALSIEAAGIEAAKLAGKPVPPKPIAEGNAELWGYDRSPGFLTDNPRWEFAVEPELDEVLTRIYLGHMHELPRPRYRVVVYALESDDR